MLSLPFSYFTFRFVPNLYHLETNRQRTRGTKAVTQNYGNQSSARRGDDDYIHERPAWIIPLLLIICILILSGGFLYYYFGPTTGEILGRTPLSSIKTEQVETIIGNARFLIPENYTRFLNQRSGGKQNSINLHALLPDLQPYEEEVDEDFNDHSAMSNVVFITLAEKKYPLSSSRRLKEVYSKHLAEPQPEDGPNGLQLFRFRQNSGYANQELMVGTDSEGRMALIMCDKSRPQVESPNCTRSLLFGPGLELSYRYKKQHIGEWYEIDAALTRLVARFEAIAPPADLQGSITD